MKKTLKIAAIILAALLVLALVLPFAFKGRIVSSVKQEVNKNLLARVDFGGFGFTILHSFPDFTLSMKNVTIIGSGDFKNDTLANIPSLQVTMDLMSVIHGKQYEVKEVVLKDPRILLHVLRDGRANWDIMKPSAQKDSAAPGKQFRMQLKQFKVSKGSMVFNSEELGFTSTILGIEQEMSGNLVNDLGIFKVAISSSSVTADYGGIRYLSGASVNLETNLDTDMKAYKFTFTEALLKLNELTIAASGFFAMPAVGYDMDIKFAARENTFKNFLSLLPAIYSKDFAKVETRGNLAFNGFVKGIYSDKQMPAFSVHLAVDNAMFKYPGLPGAVTDIAIKADIANPDGVPDHTAIDVPWIRLKVIDNPIKAQLSLRTPVSDPQFDFKVNGSLNLADLPKVYPMAKGYDMSGMMKADIAMAGRLSDIEKQQYANVKAAGTMDASRVSLRYPGIPNAINIGSAMMAFSPGFIELTTFIMQTGKSDLSANGKLQNYLPFFLKKNEILAGNLAVKSNYLDLNQIMPADSKSKKADSTAGKGIEVPGNLNLQLKGDFGKLIYDKYTMNNVSGIVTVKDKKIGFTDLKMNMMGGQIAVSGTFNAAEPAKPLLDMVFDIKNVDLQQTFTMFNTVEALAPIVAKTKGLISAHLQMKTSMDGNLSPVLTSLSGGGNLLSDLLSIANVNTLDKIADALKMDKLRKWSLEKVNLSYEFVDGKVFVKPFPVKFGNIKANLGGSTGLDKSINYTINLEIPRSDFGGQANNVLNNMVAAANKKGAKFSLGDMVPVTLLVGGTIMAPKITTNLLKSSMSSAVDDLKNMATDELNKKKAEAEAKGREEANKYINEANVAAEKLIADAARQGQQIIDAAKSTADKLKAEAATRADQLKAEGQKNGPIATMIANKAADKVNQEAASQAAQMVAEAQKQSQSLQDKARAQTNAMKQQARDKAGIK